MSDNRFGVRFDPFAAPLPEPEPQAPVNPWTDPWRQALLDAQPIPAENPNWFQRFLADQAAFAAERGQVGQQVGQDFGAYTWQYLTQMPIRDAMAAGSQAFIDAPGSTWDALRAGVGTSERYLRENLPDYLRYIGPNATPIPIEERPTQPRFADIFAQGREPLPDGVTMEEFEADLTDLVLFDRNRGDSGGRVGIGADAFAAKYGLDPSMDPNQMAYEANLRYGDPTVPGTIADIAATAVDVFDAVLRGVGMATGAVNAARRMASLPDDEVLGLTRELRRMAAGPAPSGSLAPGEAIPPMGAFDSASGMLDRPDVFDNLGKLSYLYDALENTPHQALIGDGGFAALGEFVGEFSGLGYREAFDKLVAQGVPERMARVYLNAAGIDVPHAIALAGTGVYTPLPAAISDIVQLPDGTEARELRLLWHAARPGTPAFQRWDLSRAGYGAGGTNVHGSRTIWLAEDPALAVSASTNSSNATWGSVQAVDRAVSQAVDPETLLQQGLRSLSLEPVAGSGHKSGAVLRPHYSIAEKILDLEQPFPDELVDAVARVVYYQDPDMMALWWRNIGGNGMPNEPANMQRAVYEAIEEYARQGQGGSGWHNNDSRYMFIRDMLFSGDADLANDFLRSLGYHGFTATSTELSYSARSAGVSPSSYRVYALFEPEHVLNFDDIGIALERGIASGQIDGAGETAARWDRVINDLAGRGMGPDVDVAPTIPYSSLGGATNPPRIGTQSAVAHYAAHKGLSQDPSLFNKPLVVDEATRMNRLFEEVAEGALEFSDYQWVMHDLGRVLKEKAERLLADPNNMMYSWAYLDQLSDFGDYIRSPAGQRRILMEWAEASGLDLNLPTLSGDLHELIAIPAAEIQINLPNHIPPPKFTDIEPPGNYLSVADGQRFRAFDDVGDFIEIPGANHYNSVMRRLQTYTDDFTSGAIDFTEYAARVRNTSAEMGEASNQLFRMAYDKALSTEAQEAAGMAAAYTEKLVNLFSSKPEVFRDILADRFVDFSQATGATFANMSSSGVSFPNGTPLVANPVLPSGAKAAMGPNTFVDALANTSMDNVYLSNPNPGSVDISNMPSVLNDELLDLASKLPEDANGLLISEIAGAPSYADGLDRLFMADAEFFLHGGTLEGFLDELGGAADLFDAAIGQLGSDPKHAQAIAQIENVRDILRYYTRDAAGIADMAQLIDTTIIPKWGYQPTYVAPGLATQPYSPSVVAYQPVTPNMIQSMAAQMGNAQPPPTKVPTTPPASQATPGGPYANLDALDADLFGPGAPAAAASANVPYQGWVEPSFVGQKVGGKAGGAPGANDGFYQLADGRTAYVKTPPDPEQAYVEWLAARIYERFGSFDESVPQSMLSQAADGQVMHISPIVPGNTLEGAMGSVPQEVANSFIEGSLADILMANWDVVGGMGGGQMGNNIIVGPNGAAYRIDNGSAFWKRAMGATKPDSALNSVSEFKTFLDSSMSPGYRRILEAAYGTDPTDIEMGFYSDLAEQYIIWRQRGLIDDAGDLAFDLATESWSSGTLPDDVIGRATDMLLHRASLITEWMREAAEGQHPMHLGVRNALRHHFGLGPVGGTP